MAFVVIHLDGDKDVQWDAIRVFEERSLAERYAVARFYVDITSQLEGSDLEAWSEDYQEFFRLVTEAKYAEAFAVMEQGLMESVYEEDNGRIEVVDAGPVVFTEAAYPAAVRELSGIIDVKDAREWYEAFVEANKPEEEEEDSSDDEEDEDDDEDSSDDDDEDDEDDDDDDEEDDEKETVEIVLGGTTRAGREEEFD